MSPVLHIIGLFEQLEREDLGRLAPATRERFAQLCQHWARIAERPEPQREARTEPRSGVLADLQRRQQHE